MPEMNPEERLSLPVGYFPQIEKENRCIVHLHSSSWYNREKQILYFKRELRVQKRLSCGYNILAEEVPNIGPEYVLSQITNLDSCKDGLYEVRIVNKQVDRETGIVDDYDLELAHFEVSKGDGVGT